MIDFQDRGAGTAVTFMHGFALDHRMWKPQVERLEKTHRTIAVDLPGFGRAGGEATGEQCPAQAVIDVLDSRGIKKTHLVGHSFGGAVAVDVALAISDRVLSLTLIDAVMLDRKAGILSWKKNTELAKAGDVEGARRSWMSDDLFSTATKNPELYATLKEWIDGYSGGHWSGKTSNKFLCEKPAERLSELKFPALVVSGEFDTPPFLTMADEYAEKLPNAKRAIIPGVGHMASLEAPDAFHALFAPLLS